MPQSLIDDKTGLRYDYIDAAWADDLQALEYLCFPTIAKADLYSASELVLLANEFPQGNFVVLEGTRVVGMGLGIRVHFDLDHTQHSLSDLVGDDGGTGDDPTGPWYYGTDISVDPQYRRRGIGKNLYVLRKRACRDLNLRGIVAGGVIPGYADHKTTMSAAAYVERVTSGELYDSTLSFQLENGFEAPGVIENYIEDPEVDNWASLIVWHNPQYQ